ncbi:MAG: hypothetical protein A2114_00785 [Candidatus Vogelbacteria bacterium GWA1_51_14]|uniref:Uncharacterized protein n=1 Tax=Candidatus Vogelbacteria bacterium GWA1_51_14 TaxID=1802435 RepID=A0A1G2Q9B6_9BACT|nr:MAG: hypothetical protein A2114_00785 [Candidatus Vogelbacteria bacterium GWA1_51_14]
MPNLLEILGIIFIFVVIFIAVLAIGLLWVVNLRLAKRLRQEEKEEAQWEKRQQDEDRLGHAINKILK